MDRRSRDDENTHDSARHRAQAPSFPCSFSSNKLQAIYVNTILYIISLCLSKVSILLLYLRILAYSYARRAAFVILGFVIIYSLFSLISTATVCTPVESFWDPEVEGHCHPGSFMWAVIGCHIGTDFLMFLLPMPVVYRMTLPPGQKLGVMLAFGLGFMYVFTRLWRIFGVRILTTVAVVFASSRPSELSASTNFTKQPT